MSVSAYSRSSLQNFVLVAGYDHRGTDTSRVDFMKLARNHTATLRNSARGLTRFTLFDVARGLVEEEIGYRGEIASVRTVAQFDPVRASHYEIQPSGIPAFRARGLRTLSIVDVYDHVAQLGVNEPGTLLELALVSHGWGGGPILVNSFDPAPSLATRHFDDKDGRASKDFAAPNMSTRKRRLFRAAFRAKTGRILNFGCANDDAARDVLDQLCRQWRPSHNSTRVYDFVFDGSRLAQYRAADPEFFCGDSLNISRSLAQCQAFLHRRKIACYSQKIADAAGVGCWAAFPGTSSGYEQDVPFPVMSVRKDSTRSGRDFTPYLHFINLRLGYVEDSMGRGFVEFTSRRLKKPSGRARDRSPTTMADRGGAVTHPSGAMPMKGQTNS